MDHQISIGKKREKSAQLKIKDHVVHAIHSEVYILPFYWSDYKYYLFNLKIYISSLFLLLFELILIFFILAIANMESLNLIFGSKSLIQYSE